ncbi:tRNA-His guanylyltransferase [Saxophila tyrrhenica]|uniref:tRNA(His) guanylyltransferase n=1 Tax=Saxophila tyrrhenica TaxID=1690608 RepID=A0AAV9PEW0_9PEZI|nr:tRNA-His guanylyltransferase [Saxophila tyrrhenica]
MANSGFEYVRHFEHHDAIPPSNWIVVRIDGRGFSKLCKKYSFSKPNDQRALDLMNAAATEVVRSLVDIVLAYGQSDEYSFIFHESATMFERRAAKLATTVATAFTAEYCLQWPTFFPEQQLSRPFPTFDGRCVAYPKRKILRDYLAWRQADCHINNLYNTVFWNLVLKGEMDGKAAEEALKGTLAADKNEILWSRFEVNYNNEPAIWRKGTVVYRAYDAEEGGTRQSGDVEGQRSSGGKGLGGGVSEGAKGGSKSQLEKERKRKQKARIAVEHVDIIGDGFWEARPYVLAGKRGHVEE